MFSLSSILVAPPQILGLVVGLLGLLALHSSLIEEEGEGLGGREGEEHSREGIQQLLRELDAHTSK